MSHFTVLVVGPEVEEQLAPYHEYECTGQNDQYIQEIDKTEEARDTFNGAMDTMYKAPDGTIHSGFDEEGNWKLEFLREPTPKELKDIKKLASDLHVTSRDFKDGKGYRSMIVQIPKGWSEVEVLTKDHETFAQWIEGYYGHKVVPYGEEPDTEEEHKYGYTLVDENGEVIKTIDRTNPDKQWDWYQIGGRWNGFFKLKPQAVGAGALGEPSLLALHDKGYEAPAIDRADQCKKGDIDIEGMRVEAGEDAAKRYDVFYSVLNSVPEPLVPWDVVLKNHSNDIEAARAEYRNQPAHKALMQNEDTRFIWDVDKYLGVTREQFIERARNQAISTFAVLKDGQWHERGSMGWWGCVSDEKDEAEWSAQFSKLIDDLPNDTLMTIVDCHI